MKAPGPCVVTGSATLLLAIAWGAALRSWTSDDPWHGEVAEAFVLIWNGCTWAGQLVLWLATVVNDRGWRPLAAVGSAAVAVQAFIGLESAGIGLQDGRISQLGAVVGTLSAAQIGLTLLWIVLIWRLKRTA